MEKSSVKVERLAEYCKNNPGIWSNKLSETNKFINQIEDKKEKKKAVRELEQAKKDFRYLYRKRFTKWYTYRRTSTGAYGSFCNETKNG